MCGGMDCPCICHLSEAQNPNKMNQPPLFGFATAFWPPAVHVSSLLQLVTLLAIALFQ